jgi:type I restriction enzyme M protein
LNNEFLFFLLKSELGIQKIKEKSIGTVRNTLKFKDLVDILIPLPTIEKQIKIVEELYGYQKIIDGCKQVIENYKPSIDIDPNWEMVELGKIFENNTTNIKPENMDTKKNKVLGLEHIEKNSGKLNINNDNFLEDVKSNKIIFKKNDILYAKLRPNLNKVFLADFEGYCSTDFIVLRAKEKINHLFYSSYFLSETFNSSVLNTVSGAQLPRTKYELIKKIRIPNPELSLQNNIGDLLYEEKKLVNNNSNLILNFEKKITDKINSIWSN